MMLVADSGTASTRQNNATGDSLCTWSGHHCVSDSMFGGSSIQFSQAIDFAQSENIHHYGHVRDRDAAP